MTRNWKTVAKLQLLTLAGGGTLLQFSGCDPTLRATFEAGIIDAVTAVFGSFLQAVVELITENIASAASTMA